MLGIQKWKAGLLCQTRSLAMEEAKVNTDGDNCKDGDGRSRCRAPGKSQTVGLALLCPQLQASSLWGEDELVLDAGPGGHSLEVSEGARLRWWHHYSLPGLAQDHRAPYFIPIPSPTCCNWLWEFAAQKILTCGEDYNWTVVKGRRYGGGRKMLKSLSTQWSTQQDFFSKI